jgi:hypothetical protein
MTFFVIACVLPSSLIALGATALMRKLAPRWGLVDQPAARKVHVTPTPLGGGIGIWLGVVVPVAAAQFAAWLLTRGERPPAWVPAEVAVHRLVERVEGRRAVERQRPDAVGVLCRIYTGWKHDQPLLKQNVEYLSQQGPARNDMYYNYHATQVMFHYGGEDWEKWNAVMRDQLVETQIKSGHARGSWNPTDHAGNAGRLYATCLSTMTLEVYYRHMPLYQKDSLKIGEATAEAIEAGGP